MTYNICVEMNYAPYLEQTGLVTNKVYKNGGYFWLTLEIHSDDDIEKVFEAGIKCGEDEQEKPI